MIIDDEVELEPSISERPNRSGVQTARALAEAPSAYTVFLLPKRGQRLELSHDGRLAFYELFTALISLSRAGRFGMQDGAYSVATNSLLEELGATARRFADKRPFRVISVPDAPTKERQRAILRRLERIPVHRAACGFVRGKGPRDCAADHLVFHGPSPRGLLVLNADARDFFHSLGEPVVRAALLGHGMPEAEVQGIVERCLLPAGPGILVELLYHLLQLLRRDQNAFAQRPITSDDFTRSAVWLRLDPETPHEQEVVNRTRLLLLQTLLGVGSAVRLGEGFLPQGAPTSPCLANLACKLVDVRLEALSKAFGAFYTRYADDFTFSWKLPAHGKIKGKTVDGLRRCAAEVIGEYGLAFHPKKVRVLSPKGQQDVVGYLVNSGRPTLSGQYRRKVAGEARSLDRPGQIYSSNPVNDRQLRAKRWHHLMGCAGHIASAHPQEAARLRALLNQRRANLDAPGRRVLDDPDPFAENSSSHAQDPFETGPSARPAGRPVSAFRPEPIHDVEADLDDEPGWLHQVG